VARHLLQHPSADDSQSDDGYAILFHDGNVT
jgi:hypothetical protein